MSSSHGQAPGPPFAAPPQRPPGPPDPGGMRALLLGVLASVSLVLFFPAAVPAGIAAVVTGARALRRAGRSGGTAPGAVPGIVVGAVAGALATVAVALSLVFLGELLDFADCRSGANTEIARHDCEVRFRADIERRLGLAG